MKDIISRFLESSGLTRRLQYAELEAAWRQALGPLVVHTRLDAVRGNVATFLVDNAALLSELNNFRKLELLSMLQSQVRGIFIRDIKFKLASLDKVR